MPAIIKISEIQLFNLLKEKLGEQQAETLVTFLKSSVREEINEQVSNIATKDFVEAKISEAKFQIILWAFVFLGYTINSNVCFFKIS